MPQVGEGRQLFYTCTYFYLTTELSNTLCESPDHDDGILEQGGDLTDVPLLSTTVDPSELHSNDNEASDIFNDTCDDTGHCCSGSGSSSSNLEEISCDSVTNEENNDGNEQEWK